MRKLHRQKRPLKNERGEVLGAINCFYDVTERMRADAALREEEERFRMLADNMSQLAWTCDLLGNFTWYNQRWYDYTSTTFDEMKDWGWKKVQHPDHVDRVVKRVQYSRETGEIWEDTFPLRSSSGEYRWFLSRAVPIRNQTGQIVRWFGTNTDVTSQREAEDALRHPHDELESLVQQRTASLRRLSSHLQHVQDEERRRIARELHDSAGQDLAAVKMNLAQLEDSGLS